MVAAVYRKTRQSCLAAVLALALGLAACGADKKHAQLADYLYRVGNTLDVDTPVAEQPSVAPFPRRRERLVELPDLRIGLLDFITFYDCDLQRLVGSRNSGLGKVMAASHRFRYEVAFLREVITCRERLSGDLEAHAERIGQLDEIIAVKRDALRWALWNATVAGPEFERFFSSAAGATTAAAADHLARTQAAFQDIAQLAQQSVDNPLGIDADRLEPALRRIAAHPGGAAALSDTDRYAKYLDAAAQAIHRRLDRHPLCFRERPSPDGRILHTVFVKFYAGRIQTPLAQLHRTLRELLSSLQKLLQTLDPQNTHGFRHYAARHWEMTPADSLWQEFERAIDAHTEAWRRVLGQCGLMPTRAQPSAVSK